MELNLRIDNGQSGLLDGFDGAPLPKGKPRRPVECPVDLLRDKPTATNCVPLVIVTDETQGDLF